MKKTKKNFSFFIIGILLLLSLQVVAFASTTTGTLLQTIDTSVFNPPSPDPSGLAFLGSTILDCDGEVNEMPIYEGANFFEMTLSGVLLSTGDSTNYSYEPVGCALNTDNGNLFVSDDNRKEIYEVHPGADGQLFTVDDIVVNIIDTLSFGNGDPEGVAYGNGALFSVDGVNSEAYKILPGTDGQFGTVDDVVTHFDTLSLGIQDPEGVAYDPDHPDHLYIVGTEKRNTRLSHVSTNGTLVRIIDYAPAATFFPSGVTAVSEAITGDNTTHVYISDRGVDNNDDPNENDGLIFKVSVPLFNGNQAPSVTVGADQIIDISHSAFLDGTVDDDGIPNPPGLLTTTWSQITGPAPVIFADPGLVDTTVSFSATGDYQLRLTADDSVLSGSDDVQITVTDVPLPFTYTYISTLSAGTAGDVDFADEDIIVYNETTASWSMYFDGSDVGLDTAQVDAFQLMSDGSFLLSFSTNGVLVTDAMSNILSIDNSDIVRFIPTALGDNTIGTFEWYFDGSDVGLEDLSENIDAIGFATNGDLLVSTSGNFSALGVSGNAEDLLAFTATSLGQTTNGTWQMFFDGSDVELNDVGNEGVNGVWVNDTNGDIHLSTTGVFSVTGASGSGADIFNCISSSTGDDTVCNSYALTWEGIAHGLPVGIVVNAIELNDGSANTSPAVTISEPIEGTVFVAGELVTFAASAVDAEDNNAMLTSSLSWDSSLDGTIGSGSHFAISALSVGVHTITALVTDTGGLTGTNSITITVLINPANSVPIVSISNPADGASFVAGDLVTFIGSVTDVEDDDATLSSALSWTSSLDGTIGSAAMLGTSTLSVGVHIITASVTDSGGLTGTNSITITINQGGVATILDIPISFSKDDAEQSLDTGSMRALKRNKLAMAFDSGNRQIVGMRFTQLGIPQGATILNAYIQFTSAGIDVTPTSLQIWGQDADNSLIFTTEAGNISSRPKTSISVPWVPAPWTTIGDAGPDQRTPNIAVVIQEIVNRTNWISGSSLVVMVTGDGVGKRRASAYLDSISAAAPLLHIEYDQSGNTAPTINISSPLDGTTFTAGDSVTFIGSVTDTEDDDVTLTSILSWTSSLDGTIGSGGTFNSSTLSVGIHTITASVVDSGNLTGTNSITITVNPANTAPTVSISEPVDGSAFSAGDLLTFTGSATDTEDDDVTLTSTLSWTSSLDGTIGSGGTFNSSALTVGIHTITASVVDSGSLIGTNSITVTVNPANTAPTVSISTPVDGATFTAGDLMTFTGSATDTEDDDVTLTSALSWTSSLEGTIGSGGTFNSSTLTVGIHTITASVVDSGSLTGMNSITITVMNNPVNSVPIVNISNPADGASFVTGDLVTFIGSATDTEDDDVTLTSTLSWTSSLDGTIGSGASFDTSALSVGVHTITASATDSGGLTGINSITITVTNNPVNSVPIVSISNPADGASFVAGDLVTFIGSVTDVEDDDATLSSALTWSSSLDGSIGSAAMLGTSTLSVGVHIITASVTDSGGLTGTNSITITINPVGGITIVDIPVSHSKDDAEQSLDDDFMRALKRNKLAMAFDDGDNQIVGMRFTQVVIPQGATILNAHIQFTSAGIDATTTTLEIWGQDTDDTLLFTTVPGDISSRPKTVVSVLWTPVPWTAVGVSGADERTPNIAGVIQEIVDRVNWVSGNSLVVMVTGDGNGKRRASAYLDSISAAAPVLHIEYN